MRGDGEERWHQRIAWQCRDVLRALQITGQVVSTPADRATQKRVASTKPCISSVSPSARTRSYTRTLTLFRERVVFDDIYQKLQSELQQKKREMANIIEQANAAYEARATRRRHRWQH